MFIKSLSDQDRNEIKRELIEELNRLSLWHRFLIAFLGIAAAFNPGFVIAHIAIGAAAKLSPDVLAMLSSLEETED